MQASFCADSINDLSDVGQQQLQQEAQESSCKLSLSAMAIVRAEMICA
jgi:hypothetical protein